jgi:hypothetical protein
MHDDLSARDSESVVTEPKWPRCPWIGVSWNQLGTKREPADLLITKPPPEEERSETHGDATSRKPEDPR